MSIVPGVGETMSLLGSPLLLPGLRKIVLVPSLLPELPGLGIMADHRRFFSVPSVALISIGETISLLGSPLQMTPLLLPGLRKIVLIPSVPPELPGLGIKVDHRRFLSVPLVAFISTATRRWGNKK